MKFLVLVGLLALINLAFSKPQGPPVGTDPNNGAVPVPQINVTLDELDLGRFLKNKDGLDVFKSGKDPQQMKHFADFATRCNKTYDNVDHMGRCLTNLNGFQALIDAARQIENGTATHGETCFADLTREEFIKMHTGARLSINAKNMTKPEHLNNQTRFRRQNPPDYFDWRVNGVVTPVRDQGQCGSCYAFASMAAMESVYSIRYGLTWSQVPVLSVEQIVDCTGPQGNYGCGGGWGSASYDYVKSHPGVTLDPYYPYPGTSHSSCLANNGMPYIGQAIGGYWFSPNEPDMFWDVLQHGPMYVALDADYLQTYTGGILWPAQPAGGWNINHAVVLVGYGVENGIYYWIVKNSWGTGWGESGYFRLARGVNSLGVTSEPTHIWFN